jgi:hypothetical protein
MGEGEMTDEKRVFILAQNYERFRLYCREHGLDQRKTVYVNRSEKLCGIYPPAEIIKLHGWSRGPFAADFGQVLDCLRRAEIIGITVRSDF